MRIHGLFLVCRITNDTGKMTDFCNLLISKKSNKNILFFYEEKCRTKSIKYNRTMKEVIVCIILSILGLTMMTNYTKLTMRMIKAIGVQRWGIMKPVFNMQKNKACLPRF